MDVHKNARLTPHCRALLVDRVMKGEPKRLVAQCFAISMQTVGKWLERYRCEGEQPASDGAGAQAGGAGFASAAADDVGDRCSSRKLKRWHCAIWSA